MTGHELQPGEVVRFKDTGQIGVVESLCADGSAGSVWCLQWVGREVPVLTRRAGALDGMTRAYATDHEVRPASCPRDWRNRLATVLTAVDEALPQSVSVSRWIIVMLCGAVLTRVAIDMWRAWP